MVTDQPLLKSKTADVKTDLAGSEMSEDGTELLEQLPIDNLFHLASQQLENAIEVVSLDNSLRTILLQPKNEIIIHFSRQINVWKSDSF